MRTAVEEIKERLSIEEVVGSYVKLERAGRNFKARCPFHHEKTASFFVSPERGGFYCFGCGAKGDIFNFVGQMEGTDFKGALTTLADRAGVKLERFRNVRSGEPDPTERLFAACEATAAFFVEQLNAHQEIKKYLAGRGLSEKTIAAWRLGFAPDDWRVLRTHLLALGFADNELLRAGLVKQSEKGGEPFDVFRHRAIFPLFDAAGRVVAFSGRTMGVELETNPKYLNSPETAIFKKSRALYGIHEAKRGIRERRFVLLVEGQVDLVLAHQAGYTNAVATSGTALTDEHLALLRRFSDNLMLVYDADESGERAALRAARLALRQGFAVKIARLPGKDPAEVIAKNPSDFSRALKESVPVVRFVLERVLGAAHTARERSRAVREEVFPFVRDIASAIERAEWIKEIAAKLGVREESVWEEVRSQKSEVGSQRLENGSQNSEADHLTSAPRLLVGLVWWQEGLSEKERQIDVEKVKKEIGGAFAEYEEERAALVFEAEARFGVGASVAKETQLLVHRFEKEKLERERVELRDALAAADRAKKDAKELLSRMQTISARIQELTRFLAE
jgi:DNA primase